MSNHDRAPDLNEVERFLGPERLAPYRRACQGDLDRALLLYRWNSAVSAAFWEVLGHGEVVLRNAMHAELVRAHRDRGDAGSWFDDPRWWLTPRARADVAEARRRAGSGAPPGKVVAELSLGFWRYLLARRYAATLWPILRHAFPFLPRGATYARTLEQRVADLHHLRNRIAHHESLIDIDLPGRLRRLEEVLGAINPSIRVWALREPNRVASLLDERP